MSSYRSRYGNTDSPELHLHDTLTAGAGLSEEPVARLVVTEGPKDIRWLIRNGAQFDRRDDGSLALGREGCHSRSRIVYAHGDATGAEVARTLIAMAEDSPAIHILEHCFVTDLLTENARLTCAVRIAQAALRRKESRGAHHRSDFPEKDNAFCRHFTDAAK